MNLRFLINWFNSLAGVKLDDLIVITAGLGSSPNLTPARELNQLIKNLRFKDEKGVYNPAAYAAVYTLKTVGKVAGSKSWHVYKPSMNRALDVSVEADAQLYLMAQELQKSVSKGQAKPKYEEKSAKPTEEII